MDLSVVIVTYHSRDHVLACLDSLEAARSGLSLEVVVVDNASGDGIAGLLAGRAPALRVLENAENVGYARAVNRGLRETSGPFVLVLNPDCVVAPGALPALRDWLLAHPKTAIAAPKLLNTDGSLEYSARAFPDHFTFLFNRYSLLTRLFPGNPWTRRYLLSDWDHASPRAVDWVSGAAMAVRRAAADAVGGMDEAFFMFNEDVDWCRRMKLGGWSVDYVPDAVVTHHIGASKGRVSERVILERHRGMIHYFRKHHPMPAPLEWLASAFIMLRARVMLAKNALGPR